MPWNLRIPATDHNQSCPIIIFLPYFQHCYGSFPYSCVEIFTEMKSNIQAAIWTSLFLTFMSIPLCSFANPIGFAPERGMSYISFFIVAAVCFTVEVVIIASFFKLFHDVAPSSILIGVLYLLNLTAFFLVLVPLQRFTKSIFVAEAGVVLIEMAGIRLCLALSGSDTTWRRSLLYASISNTFSIVISLGLQAGK